MRRIACLCAIAGQVAVFLASPAAARSPATDAQAGTTAFVDNCFSPRLTASRAAKVFDLANVRYDFYDLDPFTSAPPSPATKRAATPGSDRRCEVSFWGDFAGDAVMAVTSRLEREGITRPARLPDIYERRRTPSTALLAARRLNPRKIAVVHVGTRPGGEGIETFMYVERLPR